jgi:hypothetical protein
LAASPGPLAISASSSPRLGNAAFAILCRRAPPHAGSALLAAAGVRQQPIRLLGVDLWVDPASAWFLTSAVTADSLGACAVALPVPSTPALAGATLHAQLVWVGPHGPPPCPPTGLAATPALSITIQQ